MTEEKFAKIVDRLEVLARKSPRQYRFRVGVLASIGLGYYMLIMAGVLLCTLLFLGLILGGMVTGHFPLGAIKVFVLVGVFLLSTSYYLIQSLFVKLPPPTGTELNWTNAPELLAVLEDLRLQLELPALKKVVLNNEYNAAVVQIPKYFLMGPNDNYLVIGLPLMDSLTLGQFKSVLGHELGHLSGNHGSFSNWIYRIRSMYGRLYTALQNGNRSDFLIRGFMKRYVPYFDAYSFVLARDNEYDADRAAAETTSAEVAGQALVSISALGRDMGKSFWPTLFRSALHVPQPPNHIMSEFRNHWVNFTGDQALVCVKEDLDSKPSLYETHPSLAARLKNLGFATDRAEDVAALFYLPHDSEPTAARTLLGENYEGISRQISEEWQTAVDGYWKSEYETGTAGRLKLEELESLPVELREEGQMIDCADYLIRTDNKERAEGLIRQALDANPGSARANLIMAWLYFERKDDAGLDCIRAIGENARFEELRSAIQMGFHYLNDKGNTEEAKAFIDELRPVFTDIQLKNDERELLTKKTPLEPHGLPEEEMSKLISQLAESPLVKQAWLVRKVLPGKPFYVLIMERKKAFMEVSEADAIREFASTLKAQLPGDGVMLTTVKSNKAILSKVKKMKGSLIYTKDKGPRAILGVG